ncbi:hypothetical protein EW146_g5637 [Bondarzewia mesenterica]|uniref:SUZ domain-containing protein n=1 Tax=Bondarzewia mesenterica TaxID=1095465 RepID=A0A4S4LSY0_9AGAM|nr:hypothetical protein EW146_g5637 [Bondarzewia mesenterica]
MATAADSWDYPSTSSVSIHRAPTEPVRDAWDDDEEDEDNEKLWENANTKAPMPELVISPSSTGAPPASLPQAALQTPIRILKRAGNATSNTSSSNSQSPSSQQQSFAEREARYQAARERIFAVDGHQDQQKTSTEAAKANTGNGHAARVGDSESHGGVSIVRNPKGPALNALSAEGSAGLSRGFAGRRRGRREPGLADGASTPDGEPTGSLIVGCIVYEVTRKVLQNYNSPLRNIPGPKSLGFVRGSFVRVPEFDAFGLIEQWVEEYGHTFTFKTVFSLNKLFTMDTKPLSHILSHHEKTGEDMALMVNFDAGLLFAEGVAHRSTLFIPVADQSPFHERGRSQEAGEFGAPARSWYDSNAPSCPDVELRNYSQNPAFGIAQIRGFTEVFVEKSNELRDIWATEVSSSLRKDGKLEVDAFAWLNKVSLDIIVSFMSDHFQGFNYDFDSLHSSDDKPNELNKAVRTMFSFDAEQFSLLLQLFFPPTRIFPTERSHQFAKALTVLIEASKGIEKKDVQGRDILSLLIKANMATDLPENARLNDEEILAQVPTFIIAGHETTSTGVAWTLFALSGLPTIQSKLRAELLAHPTDTPTMDELNSLPYLDAVVREALRLHAPVGSTDRVAVQDDVIPLNMEFVDKDGVRRKEIRVAKGDIIYIPIRILNRSVEFWGEDAHEFKPERWINAPEGPAQSARIPSIWSNLLTFISGPHACIGYRFSIMSESSLHLSRCPFPAHPACTSHRMKAILFAIVRTFEFELAVTPEDIVRQTNFVGRPFVASNPGAGAQLPLLIRAVKTD